MVTRALGGTVFDGMHPRWPLDLAVLAPFARRPWTVGSFYDAVAPVADVFYSNELPEVADDGAHFRWRWSKWSGAARWWLGTPRLDSPRALHMPFFYARWAGLPRVSAAAGAVARDFGVSFVAGNAAAGALARRRLEVAIALAERVPLHTTERMRPHFPADTRATFHAVGPGLDDKLRFLERFDFNLCFENERAPGYLTEKPFEALYAGAVALYAGDPEVAQWLDGDAVIDCHDLDVDRIAARIDQAVRLGLPRHVAARRTALVKVSFESMMGRLWSFSERVAAELDARDPAWSSPERAAALVAAVTPAGQRLGERAVRGLVQAFDALPAPLRAWLPYARRVALGRRWRALMDRLR